MSIKIHKIIVTTHKICHTYRFEYLETEGAVLLDDGAVRHHVSFNIKHYINDDEPTMENAHDYVVKLKHNETGKVKQRAADSISEAMLKAAKAGVCYDQKNTLCY